jgi:gas vesicle protein
MSNNAKQLLKLLFGAGLALIEPDRRDETARKVKSRVEDWTDSAWEKFEDAADRLDRLSYALRGKERWTSKAGTFLLGLGVGVGLGMLFAPASGQEVRDSISEQASNIRDRFSEQASNLSEQARNLKDRVRDTVRREGSSGEGSPERVPRPA